MGYLEESLRIKEAIGDSPGQSAALQNLGSIYLDLGWGEDARQAFERSLALQTALGQPELIWRAYDGLSRVWEGRGQPALAIFFGKRAVNTLQGVRADIRALEPELQRAFVRDKGAVYRGLSDLLIEEGRLLEAQQVLAMLKEEEYFDFVRRDAAADIRTTTVGYADPEKPWNARYQPIATQLVRLGEEERALKSKEESALSAQDRVRLQQLEADLEIASQAFSAMLEELKSAFEQPEKERVAELARRQFDTARMGMVSELGEGTVLLQYIVLEDALRILLTTADVQRPYKLATGEKEINRLASGLLEALRSDTLDPRPLAKELYDLLIGPIAEDLEQAHARTLMASLDGVLRYVPLPVLYDGRQYLVERYAVAVYIEAAADRIKDPPKATWKVAGFGVTQAIRDFPALPGAKAELEGIVKGQGHSGGVLEGTIHIDQAFTQERLRGSLSPRFPVVHVASHFSFSPTEDDSFLLLGDGSALSLKQIRAGRFDFQNVDLLTLSACETALGGGQGREVEGLAVTTEKKGAKGVLATLWRVADQTTAALMQRMYALREGEGLSKAEALRRAQVELIQDQLSVPPPEEVPAPGDRGSVLRVDTDGRSTTPPYVPDPARPYAHPYYWGPFVLMGNWL
jgi:CHAT domain-containing protein